jgi:peptidoglycan/xylan/chitin deacetylase (PgdA/CDA1 family)
MHSIKILLYHGVRNNRNSGIQNYSNKHLLKIDFQKQMRFLKKNCNLISMSEIPKIINSNLKKTHFAVTFDDGFKNNYDNAAEILDFYKIPTTFYISTAYIGKTKMFWVDELEDIFNNNVKNNLIIRLDKKINFDTSVKEKKIIALNIIKNYCKNISISEKNRIVNFLKKKFNFITKKSIKNSNNYYSMSWKQVKALSANKYFTIGGHSHNHEVLSMLPKGRMFNEIDKCISILKSNLKTNVMHFSYPEGLENHFNYTIINYLKGKGILVCPSAINGVNFKNENLFKLKRIMVGMNKIQFPFNI